MSIQNFEKNFRWGKLTNVHYSDGSDGNPAGMCCTWNGWSLRIGWHQVALWHNYEPVINWLTPWSDRLYTFRKGLYIGQHALVTYGK